MKIRSITCFCNPQQPGQSFQELGELVKAAQREMEAIGFEVQSTRIATPPFYLLLSDLEITQAVQLAHQMESEAAQSGFGYLSLGPAVPQEPTTYKLIPHMLAATQNTFFSGIMASADSGISLSAVKACGEIIARAAKITPDGFTNKRFAALANVPAYVPFFPAAYHSDERPTFSLAIECADVALSAFTQAKTLAGGRELLLHELNTAGVSLSNTSEDLASRFNVEYKGIDFSLAPFPGDCCSLGGAMERLGVNSVGLFGSLTAAAILADTLDQGSWPRVGFNGMMMPVVEDSILASRGEVTLDLKDLLTYSAVCGAGLDTVPLPGDATPQQLSAVLLDVASLAMRLGKPLTARLMPVPGKKAGEVTDFNDPFFVNGRVLSLTAEPLSGFLDGDENIMLKPRYEYKLRK